jgi:hypothetical protein
MSLAANEAELRRITGGSPVERLSQNDAADALELVIETLERSEPLSRLGLEVCRALQNVSYPCPPKLGRRLADLDDRDPPTTCAQAARRVLRSAEPALT